MKSNSGQNNPVNPLQKPLFLWSLPFIFLYFSLPIVSKNFGASAFEIGGLFTVFTLTTLLIRPIIGWLLDRFGRKIFLEIALIVYAASMGVFAFSVSLDWLYLARLIQGIGSALLWASVNTIIADTTPAEKRGKALGKLNETTTRGGLIGMVAAAIPMYIFPQDYSWKLIFIVYTILTLVGAGLAWKHVPDTRILQHTNQQRPILSGPLLKLLIFVLIIAIPEAMLNPIYLIYLQDKFTTDTMTIALAFFPAGLAAAFLSARLGAMGDHHGRVPTMAIGLVGAGVISLLMPSLSSLIWLAVLYTLSTIMWAIFDPAATAMVADLIEGDRLGMGYGVYDFVKNLGYSVGPLLGGLLYDTVGKEVPFYINGIVLILSAGVGLMLLRKSPVSKTAVPVSDGKG